MGETDGETPEGEAPSMEGEDRSTPGPVTDTLKVPAGKRRKIKSPTPGDRRSATPVRGRSQTPFTLYLNRRSATPSGTAWRSITPFLKREEKEKTPFELGKDIKAQLICNKMVFDKALVMDISEAEVEPVRYLTSDMSVIDRAAVMDVSNVEVIYVVEEYEEEEIEDEEIEEVVVVKKKGKRPARKAKSASVETRSSESPTGDQEEDNSSPAPVKEKKTKKKVEKKEKREKSPSPKLSLKLELGGGPKGSKKMFDTQPPPAAELPPKRAGKSKLALQMEEQAKAAAKAAEEAAARESNKTKKETFEERQKRLKEEAEEKARLEEEQRRLEEEEAAAAAEEADEEDDGAEGGEEEDDGGEDAEDASQTAFDDEDNEENPDEEENPDAQVEERRRSSASSADDFTRPDPEEEERWKKIAEEEGEEFVEKLRKFSRVQRQWRSEKERDAEWQKRREQARLPAFINFLTDRAAEEGQTVKLACAVTGPELSTKWFKDGKQLEPGPKYRIINNNNILTLQVMNSDMMDSGEYTCIIKNSNDEVTSSCIVTIYQVFKDEPSPPTFSSIRDFYHLHDDELTIECHIHGIPRPKVAWIKDNVEIKPSFKFTILEEAHGVYKMLIYRPSSRDSGKYICKAVNTSGEQEISHIIEFTKPKHFHAHGLRHAHNLISQSIEAEAKKAMDEALKSKAESDNKRQPVVSHTRSVDEPIVPPKQKLKFATQLRDRIALEKATVKLVCNIIGPNPAVKWLKDDNPLQWGPKIRNLSTEGQAVLELGDVGSSSSGVYKLIAKNDHSEIDTSCYLKIYSAQTEGDESEPMFALPIKDVYHSSENDLIISTKVRGNPRPTITWIKDDLAVVADSRTQQIEHLDGICELIINKPTQRQDSGVYTCVADNTLGSAKTTHTVVIDNLPSSRRSSTTMSLGGGSEADGARSKKEGSTVSSSGPDGAPKPPKREKREKKEEPVEESGGRRRVAMPDPTLKEKLYFIVNMTNRYLPIGSRCKMQAVIGGPDPQIKWLKNGQPVVYGPKIRNMSNSGMAILEFLNATEEDSGEYTLICRNQANEITTTGILHIYDTKVSSDAEPVFTRALKDTYHLHSNELILESHVRGLPAPIVQWFKDSVEIKNNEKYQINELPDGTCELVIDKPNQYDTGKYVCTAENRAGKCEISHVVLFKSQPTHIAENIHGVFHADKNLFKKTKDVEEIEPEKSEAGDTDSVSSKGKGKGRSKPPSASKETTPAVKEPEPKEPEKPFREEKREKRIGIYFATKLSDRVIAEGSKVKLSCYVQSSDPQVRWFKDDQAVVYGPKSKQMFMQGLCTLELPNAAEDDTGIYKCFAKDNTGEVTTTCKITVYPTPGSGDVPPTFTRSIKDSYRHKINEIVLDVHVRGLPTPSVSWVKDGVKLEPSEKYQMTQHDDGTCELFISDPLPRDGGKYVCKAENRADETEIVHIVHVDAKNLRPISPVRDHQEPEEEKEVSKEPSTREGSKTRENSKAGDSRPPTREGSKVQDGDGKEEEKKEKKGKKKQEVEYAGRREPPPPPDTKRMLHFGNFLSNRTIAEGSTVRMSVYIGGPDPQCRWFKGSGENEQPIVYTPKTKMSCQDNLALLILTQLTEEDSDEYKLVARGTENTIETSCKVNVYKIAKEESTAPVFTVGIKDVYSITENELTLDCRVRGNPRPTIKWTKDSEPIVNNDKYNQLDQADGYCKLIISNPTVKDSGNYVCEAENSVQCEKISHPVVFAGQERFIQEKTHGFFHRDPNKPHFLSSLGNHIVTIGGTIAIQAEFAITNSEINVQWLKDKLPLSSAPTVKKFIENGVYTLAISDASDDHDGLYTCRAINAFGKAESSANVHISSDIGKSKMVIFISRPDPEMKICVGDPFSISFRVQGDPKPKLTLMKGTKDITRSDRISKEGSDDYTRFTIHNSKLSDSGTYFVVARNENSTDRIFVTVTVRQRIRSVTPTLPLWGKSLDNYSDFSYFKNPPGPISTEPMIVDSGKHHISLSWGKPVVGDSAPVVAYRVDAWMIGGDGGAVWKELGMTGLNSFDAFNLKPGSSYHIRVTPRNRYGWGESVKTTYPITIGGAECLPEFVKILPGQMKALTDQECILECTVRGTPRPRIVWYKDGQPIPSTDRVMIKQIGFTCKLKISQVFDIDSGRYTCEAANNTGRVSTFARLQVVSDPKICEADNKLKMYVSNEANSATNAEMIPMFTMRLRDRRVQVTYPVRMTCQVVGHPPAAVTWYKDGNEIDNDSRFLCCDDGQFNTLEISKTCLDDSGTYTATAKNEMGSVSCHCSLIVDKGIRAYIAPDFYQPLEPVYVYQEGQEIRLTAKVEAYPSVGVAWHRNGARIRPSRRILATLNHDGFVELIIADATLRDAGIYVCVASNPVGRIESSCRVVIEEGKEDNQKRKIPMLRSPDMPYSKEPMFVTKPRSTDAYEGDTVIIFCEVVGDPKPEVVWLRDFLKPEYYKDAPHFRRIGDGPEYRLEIPSAKLDFTGTYSVIATNCHGETQAIISLQIKAKDISNQNAMEKGSIRHGNVETFPSVIRHLKDLRCCDGDSITLECHVEAVPEPIVMWEKDGHILSSDKDFEMTYNGIRATLSIPRVYPEDEGEYTCIATNNIGRSYSSACVLVDVPEEKENLLSRQLARPSGLILSANSTPRSTPRGTPIRNVSPLRLSFRNTSIDLSTQRRQFAAPKFYAIPHNRVVEEGESVRFQCAIAGHPLPWSTWDKDGMIVAQTARISVKERDDLRVLEIDEVTFEDAGLYRITLENDFGRIEATARLDVIASSRHNRSRSMRGISNSPRRNLYISRRIMGPSTRIGGRMALSCSFRGSSVPARKFYHNGDEIIESERCHIYLTDYDACLVIDDVTKLDEGIYTCIAQNESGLLTTTTSVVFYDTIEDIPIKLPRIIRQLPKELRITESESVDLSFEIEETCVPYSYVWTRNGDVLINCDEFRYIDHGNGILALRILDTFDLDAGFYTCTIKTQNGSCTTTCDLIVDEERFHDLEQCNLTILKNPLPSIGLHGSIVSFCAKVYPLDAITKWIVCGREITCESREFSIETQPDGVRILHILGIEHNHSGEIKFQIEHPIKHRIKLFSYTDLIVLPSHPDSIFDFETTSIHNNPDVPVLITKGPKDCTAFIGGTISLDVQFGGRPIPKVNWFKAGRPITESSNIIVNTTDINSILQLTSITADDSGKYTVEIMNEHSSDFAVASVAVEGPPEPPGGKPSVSQGPDRIAVAWCGPPYDGGCMITGFIIELQENTSDWIEIATVVDSLAYTVKNLLPDIKYKFRIRAENIHGRSEPGLSSDEVIICNNKLQEYNNVNNNEDDIENELDYSKSPISIRQGGEFKARFEMLEELGKGRFGVVYKVMEKETKQVMAAKIIKCIKSRDRIKVQDEILIMKSLKHPKLLQLAATFETVREIYMVMEYITGGELFERVVADDFTLTERDCILFLRQICEGVDYMHSQSIVHLDLKPENIMCHTRTSHKVKIIDFGLAQKLNNDSPIRVLFGTPEFIAPEIINYEPISFKTDMWSIGVICYVLLSGLSPFMGDSDVDTFSNITRADYDFDDDAFDAVSQEAKDFISNLLVHRKEDRLTAKECFESKWLAQYHDENLSNNKICTDKLKKFIIRRKWQIMPQKQATTFYHHHHQHLFQIHQYHNCDLQRQYG